MSRPILSDARVRHKPATAEDAERVVQEMAAAGYPVLTIAHATSMHVDAVKVLLALDICE